MANQEHLDILKQGVDTWNRWRRENPNTYPNLSNANFSKIDLSFADLRRTILISVDLSDANLGNANLSEANLSGANLSSADLSKADLSYADLSNATIREVSFRDADLRGAIFNGATHSGINLKGVDFSGAKLGWTLFGNFNLRVAKGLDSVLHHGPSTIGIDTIYLSKGNIPEMFLKGAGVDDTFITYISSLVGKAIEYYSCFISYSSKDEAFAKRLYADLQSNNVRCWFAPEDMKIGDKIRPRIDESIRLHDKLLLVLSEHSVCSKWVEYEVEAALSKEQEGKPPVLFPVRLDNTVMESTTAWATHIKRTRHIGDFSAWKDHDRYQIAFARLLHDLKSRSR